MRYFAYGSNMSLARLTARAPSARRLGTFTLFEHDLRFHKKGVDGSGKCDAYHTGKPADRVVGSLFEIDLRDKPALDAAEGLGHGYSEKQVVLCDPAGSRLEALTYCALIIDQTLKPYSWYLQHVLVGAREADCPTGYIRRIAATAAIEDANLARDFMERALHH